MMTKLDDRRLLSLCCVTVCFSVVLFYSYRSTDFEVHRNWLALTYNLPVNQWYFENTSKWTLDYPPYFAYFEFALSHIAALVETEIVEIRVDPYESLRTIFFQRSSVVLNFCWYLVAAFLCCKNIFDSSSYRLNFLYFLFHAGLLLLDIVHFQYNAMLFGFLLLSIRCVSEGKMLTGAFLFCVLLNLKHIFLYLAPAYAVYFLKNYCFNGSLKPKNANFANICKLALLIMSIFSSAFSPFASREQLPQLFRRLFPFKRGLTHAYWAPNFWALYNAVDFTIYKLFSKLFGKYPNVTPGYTTGLVQEFEHLFLPNVTPFICFLLTLTVILPFCYKVFVQHNRPDSFLKLSIVCGFSSYMFGWHVHEKAILLCSLPIILLSSDSAYAKLSILLNAVANVSLMPLFFTHFENIFKVLLVLMYFLFSYCVITKPSTVRRKLFSTSEIAYLTGFLLVEIYHLVVHDYIPALNRFEFFPLLLTSVYCSFGVIYCFLNFIHLVLRADSASG